MALIRPKDEPAATSVAVGDIFLIDGATGVRGLAATAVVTRDTVTGIVAITSASASALAVGPNGATNPAFRVNTLAASAVTGIEITSLAAAGGLALGVISSGTNEGLAINAKGTGPITVGNVSTGTFNIATTLTYGGVLLANSVSGTGSMVLSTGASLTNATLVTPALGTPASGVATNLTGTAAGLTAGHVTTNANLTGPIASVGNATSVTAQTGTGTTFVMNTSPTLVTPVLGAATGTSIALNGAVSNNAGTITGINTQNGLTDWQITNASNGNNASAAMTVTNDLGSCDFEIWSSTFANTLFTNRAGTIAGSALNGLLFTTAGTKSIDFAVGNVFVGGFLTDSTFNAVNDVKVNGASVGMLRVIHSVNFNSVGDTSFTPALPAGYTRYQIYGFLISAATGTLTTSTVGVFSAAAGAGSVIVTSGTAVTVNTAANNTAGNSQFLSNTALGASALAFSPLFFRVTNPQGVAASATVTLIYLPIS